MQTPPQQNVTLPPARRVVVAVEKSRPAMSAVVSATLFVSTLTMFECV